METERSEITKNIPHSSLELTDTDKDAFLRKLIISCRQEMENNSLNIPLKYYVDRVINYTGISKRYINKIISKQLGDIDYGNRYLELFQRIHIFNCLADMYISKQIPTYSQIHTMMQNLNIDINFNQFQYTMSCLGFENRREQSGNHIVIENPDLTFERYLYLKQIKNFRLKSAQIYYIDEIFLDSTLTFTKPWLKNIDISSIKCDGYVFFHAVSKNGFLNGLFCAPTTTTDFMQWITHILIPQLHEPSILVMDKNDLHRSRVNVMTKYHSKKDMLNYLMQNNIPCSADLHKAELYKLISEFSVKGLKYDLDEIVKSHGHQILWLPSTFHDLSLTHFLWKYILSNKPQLFSSNISLQLIKNTFIENLITLPLTFWQGFDKDLNEMEAVITNIDLKAHQALEAHYTLKDTL